MTSCAALIVAAGRGSRFGSKAPKQYAELRGQAVLRHSLTTFSEHPGIDRVVAVIHPDDHIAFAQASKGVRVAAPVIGGATRQESVRLGLDALADNPPGFVLVHDGARPLASHDLIDRVLTGLSEHRAVVPVLAVPDTLKQISENGAVEKTIPRQGIVRAQTPQGFEYAALRDAHEKFADQSFTDDSAVMEAAGHSVHAVEGDSANIKITTQSDLHNATAAQLETRTAMGFDVHRFGPGDGVTLGGVFIPMDKSLLGHSDADVVLHAATDAILGALADGDIGLHFPPSNPAYRGAPSKTFLAFAMERLKAQGGQLILLDLTVICEHPKLSPVRNQIRQTIAQITGIAAHRISVKATTTEGLGFTGRGEGIACQAVATIRV